MLEQNYTGNSGRSQLGIPSANVVMSDYHIHRAIVNHHEHVVRSCNNSDSYTSGEGYFCAQIMPCSVYAKVPRTC